jgi:hypothetical protein
MRDVIPKGWWLFPLLVSLAACGSDSTTSPSGGGDKNPFNPSSCTSIDLGGRPAALSVTPAAPKALPVLGNGAETARYTAEIAVRGTIAYTTTWSFRGGNPGNKINVWDVSGNTPTLLDSVIVSGATTLGDVAVSDDGALLIVATERTGGSIVIFDLVDPKHPKLISRFTNSHTDPGVHTAEIGRVNGKLYGFLSVDPAGTIKARLVVVDLSTPSAPREVFTQEFATSFIHDTFVRDGLLFLALWDNGLQIWDLGGCGDNASPENPRVLGGVTTVNGHVHNVWWYHDANGGKRFAFVGEELGGSIGSTSAGDIHVVDISDPTQPQEVAFYRVDGAGTHNFSVDEAKGVLYAAYYNGGVRALDIRGDLASCAVNERVTNAAGVTRCDLRLMGRELATGLLDAGKPVYVWGVQYLGGSVYASDMLNGIWKLGAAK